MNAPFVKPPADYKLYNQKLRATMDEKLFFLPRLPKAVRVFVDFGCAGGDILAELRRRHRTIAVCGYDIDEGMLSLARQQLANQNMGSEYQLTSKWEAVERFIKTHTIAGNQVCIILSSVVHEVVSGVEEYMELLKKLYETKADYLAIRDMALTSDVSEERKLAIQALMKLPYTGTKDFDKECEENYFPLSFEAYLNLSTIGSGYKLRHIDHTPLRWLQDYWVANCGTHISEPTHIKMILKRY